MATPLRSNNPALNEKHFEQFRVGSPELDAGWATAQESFDGPTYRPPTAVPAMTNGGVTTATGVLLVLLVASAAFGWNSVEITSTEVQFPGWLLLPMLGGFGVAILTIFKPLLARFTAPVYALLQGSVLGAISAVYNEAWNGIVVQAVSLTIGVFAVMLFLHATHLIRVTEKLRMGIIAATGAIALIYLANLVLSLFDAEIPFLHDTGAVGIAVSLAIVVVAAMNLLLDFDFVERGVAAGIDKRMEWFAAFGLVLTLVWLYLELLRLLSKLRN
jgi:uncharacterized YccA/Bax inhibitor family protein